MKMGSVEAKLGAIDNILGKANSEFGNDEIFICQIKQIKALVLEDSHHFYEAENLLLEVIEKCSDIDGLESKKLVLSCKTNLATLYYWTGQRDRAIEIDKEVLELSMSLFGNDGQDNIRALINLATSYIEYKQYDQALSFLLQAKYINEKSSKPHLPSFSRN